MRSRATATGAVASIVTGTATTLIWKYGVDKTGFSPLLAAVAYPAAFCSIAALVLGSYATAAPPTEVWRKFCDDGEGLTDDKCDGVGACVSTGTCIGNDCGHVGRILDLGRLRVDYL